MHPFDHAFHAAFSSVEVPCIAEYPTPSGTRRPGFSTLKNWLSELSGE
jgi:hypothetical protein